MTTRYADAGVDLDIADTLATNLKRRLGGGLFGGFVPIGDLKRYDSPVLVSSIDGIGTKVRLACEMHRYEGLGQDIVHHCVNDIAVHGARPLLFLDYLAFNRLDPHLAESIVTSIADACAALGITLAGGETAEMPAVYTEGRFDVAGAVVGVVEEAEIVDGRSISHGDVVLGLRSSGLHTNGFSLVQHIFSNADLAHHEHTLSLTLGEALLTPHRCYLEDVGTLLATGTVHGLAHITGGGIAGNLSRIIPPGLQADIDLPPPPPLFDAIQERGVPRDEMLRVFNMGIGMIAVCDPTVVEALAGGGASRPDMQSSNQFICLGRVHHTDTATHDRRVLIHDHAPRGLRTETNGR